MKFSRWNINEYDLSAAERIAAGGIPLLASHVLAARGYSDSEDAGGFVFQGLEQMNDPLLLPDMERGVRRVCEAIDRNEKIAVYGDYDVDGITSLAVMYRRFRDFGIDVIGYIPDRIGEGYGINCGAVKKLAEQGVKLIITVDCGITAVEEVEYAKTLGVDVIITDHHECKEMLPDAAAVINPRRSDCCYPFKDFAGIGVAYKFLCGVFKDSAEETVLFKYATLVAIGTVADVMPLTNENRVIVRAGLAHVKESNILGLRKLMQASGMNLDKGLTSQQISYIIAPRINAAGRMGEVYTAVKLLITSDENEAENLAARLVELNRERQKKENDILNEALATLSGRFGKYGKSVVIAGEEWHQGVIGIVASRIAEKCHAPAFMVSFTGDTGKASARSYGGFNLFKALEQADSLLESFGGHALAAGFTIRRENLEPFSNLMEKLYDEYKSSHDVSSALDIDLEIKNVSLLVEKEIRGLDIMEPFGTENPSPVFCMSDVYVDNVTDVGNGKHMKLSLKKDCRNFDAIFFSNSSEKMGIEIGDMVDIAFNPVINEFRGRTNVQLQLKDIRQCRETRRLQKEEFEIYDRFRSGGNVTRDEIIRLTPTRRHFVKTWRYLKIHTDGYIEGDRAFIVRKVARAADSTDWCYMRFMICIDCFEELGLLDKKAYEEQISLRVYETKGKVELSDAPTMKRLISMLG